MLCSGTRPWERIKLQEKEWFAERRPDIATAANASLRRKRITELRTEDPLLYAAFQDALRHADGESAFILTLWAIPAVRSRRH